MLNTNVDQVYKCENIKRVSGEKCHCASWFMRFITKITVRRKKIRGIRLSVVNMTLVTEVIQFFTMKTSGSPRRVRIRAGVLKKDVPPGRGAEHLGACAVVRAGWASLIPGLIQQFGRLAEEQRQWINTCSSQLLTSIGLKGAPQRPCSDAPPPPCTTAAQVSTLCIAANHSDATFLSSAASRRSCWLSCEPIGL